MAPDDYELFNLAWREINGNGGPDSEDEAIRVLWRIAERFWSVTNPKPPPMNGVSSEALVASLIEAGHQDHTASLLIMAAERIKGLETKVETCNTVVRKATDRIEELESKLRAAQLQASEGGSNDGVANEH